ncbi:MAG: hypothetical protein KDK70_40825, partial [Myxococcales bacterium]|nr:hypothetical protein [Myxococcales bacterium]
PLVAFARMAAPPYVPLPAEPVGVGARWRYETPRSPLGPPMTWDVEWAETVRDRLHLRLSVRVAPTAAAAEAAKRWAVGPFEVETDAPTAPEALTGTGHGAAVIDRQRLSPIELALDLRLDGRLVAATGLGEQRVAYTPALNWRLKAR